ncbi:Inosine/uridine-preferring nucleoside hydrolase [Piedraia hortae CBS 480.64]|uniref:Inosine/uridine-preferring nucleoside hydrolase n=1 Tax=Piedraia hortae CBS 480.64 TaxID=1314780 RepID=A0A6A7BYJ9_9PEZI|nr:Inosine/uridine-preferring nucleoside hydrolase [Piedraia hortae CBS 480.64]
MPVPLWLDCDTGHDDAFALLLYTHSPADIKCLGVSTVFGNAPLECTTWNTRAVLKAIGREGEVEVHTGSREPWVRPAQHYQAAESIHGTSGLDGDMILPTPTIEAKHDAVEAMHTALVESNEPAWLVATGPLTNVAKLFHQFPDLAGKIAGLSIMGGAVSGGFTSAPLEGCGNWTAWAEFNIYCDPEAASAVFANRELAERTVLVPLDLTHQFLATEEIRTAIAKPLTPTRKLFAGILQFFAKTYSEVFGFKEGPPVHDMLAVATAAWPSYFDFGEAGYRVKVVTEGEQCGRTIIEGTDVKGIKIPRGLDTEKLWKLVNDALDRVE